MKRANGMGSIIDRGKSRRLRYSVRITVGYDENGKQLYKYISSHQTRKEAEKVLADFITNPYDLNGANMTFAEVYELAIKDFFCGKQKQIYGKIV